MRSTSEAAHFHGQPLETVVVATMATTYDSIGCLKAPVPTLYIYHAVCFGMVGRCGLDLNGEDIEPTINYLYYNL